VTTVYVEGNVHYSNEEIIALVMEGRYGNNSLFLSMKYRNKSMENIPFVEKMDISVLDPHTVKIEVYEKALAGYVEYLDRYMYFDKDGIVVESSSETTKGIPMVTGLSFDHVILYQALPVENPEIFNEILSITQLVNKYDLSVDRIYFGMDDTLTLYFDDVKAAFGAGENLEAKVMELQYILPELEGKSGTLRMENYTEETKTITFEPD
jgi:cell division protein FtsQ